MDISTALRFLRLIWGFCLVLAFGAWLLASCSGERPSAPATVIIASERPYAERALELGAALLAPHGLDVVAAVPGDEPHITVGQQVDAGSAPFVTGYWAIAVAWSSPVWGHDMATLAEALQGDGDTSQVLVPVERAPPVREWWPEIGPLTATLPLADIAGALEADANAIALLPLDAVGAEIRVVPVAGFDIVFGEALFGDGDVETYPLVERAWVSAAAHESPDFALLLQQTKRALAERLALDFLPPDPIILRATGDIIPARCVYAKQRDYSDFAHAFRELGPWLSEADITVGSLDASISDAGRPFGCTPTFSLLAPAQSVEGLAYAGFDVVTVATNHVKDCGQDSCGDQAFFDTLSILRSNGIEPVGGGRDLAEARRPAILEVRGITFAFLGADQIATYYHAAEGVPGVAPLTEAFLREDVAAAAVLADVVVVLPQWGVEYTNHPTASQQTLAAAAAEAGADLVIGNHPHWVQAVDVIGETYVAYALGNFVFDQDWSVPTQQGVVLEAAFHGADLKGVRLHPIRIIDQHQPTFPSVHEASEILGRIWAASAALR